MLAYVLRRLAATIPVMLIVASLVFLMLRLTPSDPAAIIAGDTATTEQVAEIRKRLGLDQPILTQFVIWMTRTLQGDFGELFFFKKQVAELILDRLEPTASLALLTIVLAVLIAVPLGVIAAYRHGGWLDRIVMGFSVLGFSVPVFVIAYMLIYVFAIELNWLPVQGYQRIRLGIGGWLQRLILPSLTLSVIYIALIARITRTSVLEVMNEDYIRTARAKGQTEGRVLIRHALANAAVPIVTVIGLGVALLIGGVVVTECVYTIPGIGRLDRRCRACPRLPDHPGRDLAVLARLRAHQPGCGCRLHVPGPEDPLLSIEALPGELAERAPAAPRWERCARWRATRASSSAERSWHSWRSSACWRRCWARSTPPRSTRPFATRGRASSA